MKRQVYVVIDIAHAPGRIYGIFSVYRKAVAAMNKINQEFDPGYGCDIEEYDLNENLYEFGGDES